MQEMVTDDSTNPSYWLNWRVLLCAIWILLSMVMSAFIIWKYESLEDFKSDGGETQPDALNVNLWQPSIEKIHPLWMLAFRVIAFCLLLIILIVKIIMNGASMLYYYTQWTFILVTIYFGFGSLLSIYGCYQHHKLSCSNPTVHHNRIDAEQGNFMPLANGVSTNVLERRAVLNHQGDLQASGIISHLFQVIFQMSAGAAMLTDCIYWLIIFPFLTVKDYDLNFMTVIMHTLNAAFLLGDTALNCLPFPWFRISYFVLWTSVYVIFQWLVHACVSIWWPYPFLVLSSTYAPLWYLFVGLMHIPCYAIFALIVKMKHYLLSKWFPQSYRCLR